MDFRISSLRILAQTLVVGAIVIGLGCARSQTYEAERNYYEDYPHTYYGRQDPGDNASEKIASIAQPKKRIVVFDFWNATPLKSDELGPFGADELRRELYVSGRVIIPTEHKLVFTTENFLDGESIKVEQLVREGRRLGVAVVIIGRITRTVFRSEGSDIGVFSKKQSIAAADVEIKVFDVASGREIMAVQESGQAAGDALPLIDEKDFKSKQHRVEIVKMAVRDATAKLVKPVVVAMQKMSWQGRVAKVTGKKIYVNAGRASGLVAGDILKVMTPGTDIFDPASGAFLGRTKGQLKGTLEVVDFVGPDGAQTQVHTGGNIDEGDVVQLY